jgi:hypothetical protein
LPIVASRSGLQRTTSFVALAFGVVAMLAAVASVAVVASRPWGCSVSGDSPVVSCDWVTSRWLAAAWLVVALVVGLISWKRWTLPLGAISLLLVAFSAISILGVFTMAPAALWLACALWLWSRDRPLRIALSAVASAALLGLGTLGLLALYYLAGAPI